MANTLRFKRGLVSGIPTGIAGEPLFTTDTFDLYIGNGTTNTRFQKYIASGTTAQYLRGDGSLATFPTDIVTGTGVSGQVAYWSGTNTQVGSNNLFWDATNNRLGIGTNTPSAKYTQSQAQGVFGRYEITNANADQITGSWDVYTNTLVTPDFFGKTAFKYEGGSNNAARQYQIYVGDISTPKLAINGSGSLMLGSVVSTGQRLQVTGDTLLKGSGNTSATTALTVQNSGGTNMWRFLNDGELLLGSNASGAVIFPSGTDGTLNIGGLNTTFYTSVTTQAFGAGAFNFWGTTLTSTSGFNTQVSITRQFTPTSGTAQMYYLVVSPTINQTGGANGITRGLYVNPTLTAAADWRSIETSNNSGFAFYGAGTANSFFNGSVGIGSTLLTGVNLYISKNISGGAVAYGMVNESAIQSSVTSIGVLFQTNASTQNTNFALSNLRHYSTLGATTFANVTAGGSVTNQFGFFADSSLTGATNNYGFYGNISSGTGRWNLYMNGTAANYLNGNTGIGTTGTTERLVVRSIGNSYASSAALSIENNTGANKTYLTNANGVFYLTNSTSVDQVALYANGNLVLSGTSDTGEKLQVNGTMKVTGASTFGADTYKIRSVSDAGGAGWRTVGGVGTHPEIYFYQAGTSAIVQTYINGVARLEVTNTGIGVTGAATFSSSVTAASLVVDTTTLVVDATNDRVGIGTASPTAKLDVIQSGGTAGISVSGGTNPQMRATDGTITAKVQAITGVAAYIGTESNHQLRLITNNSPRLTIDTTGAATFTSSIAAAGNLLLGASASTIGAMNLILTGTSPVASRLTFGTDGTGYSFAIGKNQAGTVTDLFSILDSGAANFTTSIQAGTAIAIGTTPDTNKPFKILKNINATVGINFENTSTGSTAFSAIQMGTDVTGGTKFTNLVYGSSGITQNGVYHPDGTSLINNGGGGLNFLGTPTRFYTGGSNGIVRLYLDNNGLTQLNATTPTTNETDGYRQYSADVVAGNAAPHFRTENGAVIKIYQETTGVGNAIFSAGGGTGVLDDSTFDGYTLRQIVKALRNQGILA